MATKLKTVSMYFTVLGVKLQCVVTDVNSDEQCNLVIPDRVVN
jgi:hypothetical protein